MSIPLPIYAKIKDRYCITYFGNCNEYLVQLRCLRPIMEKTFPGVEVYIAHKEVASYIFKDCTRTITKENLIHQKNNFAYIRELTCDMYSHPVEAFMEESDIPFKIELPSSQLSNKQCVILTKGILPTKNLTEQQIKAAKQHAENKGYNVTIDGDITNVEWVVGVENEKFYEAALAGYKTTLIPTGIGENLYKKMFFNAEILRI